MKLSIATLNGTKWCICILNFLLSTGNNNWNAQYMILNKVLCNLLIRLPYNTKLKITSRRSCASYTVSQLNKLCNIIGESIPSKLALTYIKWCAKTRADNIMYHLLSER